MPFYSDAEPLDLEPESVDLTIRILPVIYPVTTPNARWNEYNFEQVIALWKMEKKMNYPTD